MAKNRSRFREIIKEYHTYLLFSLRQRGIWQSLNLWFSEFCYTIKYGRFIASRFEVFPAILKENYEQKGYLPYQPTYYKVLLKSFSTLEIDPERSTFIDIGCGKGKVLKFAGRYGFKKTIGIEIIKKLADKAEKKLIRNKRKYKTDYTLLNLDCLDYLPNEKIDVMFFYNPFKCSALNQFLKGMINSTYVPKYLIYVNPVCSDLVCSLGFEVVHTYKTGKYTEFSTFKFDDSKTTETFPFHFAYSG